MTSRRSASCCGLAWPPKVTRPWTRRTPRLRSISWPTSLTSSSSTLDFPTCRASICSGKFARERGRADRRPVEPRRRDGQGRSTRSRRRRLRHQAVRHGGIARPHPYGAPTPTTCAGRAASFKLGDLSVDLVRRVVKKGDEEVKLSPKEYELLRVLVQHAGKVLTHKFLLKELWAAPIDPQYLRVYVRQLRHKIEPDPARPQ